jgi:nicotinate-nucleotide adenylyltransferase
VNTGIFGGTFDPPHLGHLIVARDAALALGLDRVLFVPAASPPHKQGVQMTPARQRAQMLELAIRGDEHFSMDTLELKRQGASYSIDTLRELTGRHPDVHWTLLIGADQYREFATWRDPEQIRRLARIAVVMRGGTHGAAEVEAMGTAYYAPHRPPVHDLDNGDVAVGATRIDISATSIRRRVADGLPIRYLVPPAVEDFIFEQGLYVETALRRRGSTPDQPERGTDAFS